MREAKARWSKARMRWTRPSDAQHGACVFAEQDEAQDLRLLASHVDRLRRPARYRARPHLAGRNEETLFDHRLEVARIALLVRSTTVSRQSAGVLSCSFGISREPVDNLAYAASRAGSPLFVLRTALRGWDLVQSMATLHARPIVAHGFFFWGSRTGLDRTLSAKTNN